ncbi:MAG: hypothetical protein H6602_10750 [Flavobacteriales bacterium]|nr:hypothetical protein [Flavobacteriales bacterium]
MQVMREFNQSMMAARTAHFPLNSETICGIAGHFHAWQSLTARTRWQFHTYPGRLCRWFPLSSNVKENGSNDGYGHTCGCPGFPLQAVFGPLIIFQSQNVSTDAMVRVSNM